MRSPSASPRAVVVLAATMVTAFGVPACGGSGSSDSAARHTTAVEAPRPVPTITDSPLSAGRPYVSRQFRPGLTFTLPDGAWVGQDARDGLTMRLLPNAPIHQGILSINRIRKVFDPRRGGRTVADAVSAPADFATWLEHHPRLAASKPVPVTFHGLHGVQVDVTPKSFPHRHPAECDRSEQLCTPVWFAGSEGVVYPKNTKTRFLVLDDHGRQLVVEAFADPADAFPTVWPVLSDALKTVRLPAR